MKKFGLSIALIAVLTGLSASAAPAGSPKVVEVSLFKNGLGYFLSEGSLEKGSREVYLKDIPKAVHGTYWFDYDPKTLSLKNLIVTSQSFEKARPAVSVYEMLKANLGKELEIFVDNKYRAGKIIALPEAEKEIDWRILFTDKRKKRIFQRARIMIFERDGAQEVIPVARVSRLRSAGKLNLLTSDTVQRPVLRVDYKAKKNSLYRISYLSKGISWVPSYEVDISDAKEAELRLKGLILNEAQDLSDVNMNFISGYPNLSFSDVLSPISAAEDLSSFMNSLTRGGHSEGRAGRGYMLRQRALSSYAMESDASFSNDYNTSRKGEYAEDLFYYEIPGVSLKKGERGYYEILAGKIPYQHIYTWSIPNTLKNFRNRFPKPSSKSEDIWHSLKLTNDFKQPLTTGAAVIVSKGKILGQDVLHYTSRGGKTRLRITKALDIKAKRNEFEKERKRNAETFHGSRYDLVTVEGVLSLESFKKKDVRMEIDKVFEGNLLEVSHEGKETKVAEGLRNVNPTTRLHWELDLPAGKTVKLKYSYMVYVR